MAAVVKKITLHAWAEARYDPAPTKDTLWRWARDAWIFPPPEKVGRTYYVHPNAVFIGNDPAKARAFYEPEEA